MKLSKGVVFISELNTKAGRQIYNLTDKFIQLFGKQIKAKQPSGCLTYKDYTQLFKYLLKILSESIGLSSPQLFSHNVSWQKARFNNLGIPEKELRFGLQYAKKILQNNLDKTMGSLACSYINTGLKALESPVKEETFICEKNHLGKLAEDYLKALLHKDHYIAKKLILESVKSGISVADIYLHVFTPVLYEIGRLWQSNKLTVAQEHFCSAVTQRIISQLFEYITPKNTNGHTMVATCVSKELHEIGLRMVSDFFEMEGWSSIFLGANLPEKEVLQTIVRRNADIICISATMTFHVNKVKTLIQKVHQETESQGLKILVGGYPFNIIPDLWKKVGADGYSKNPKNAIKIANKMLNKE